MAINAKEFLKVSVGAQAALMDKAVHGDGTGNRVPERSECKVKRLNSALSADEQLLVDAYFADEIGLKQ